MRFYECNFFKGSYGVVDEDGEELMFLLRPGMFV